MSFPYGNKTMSRGLVMQLYARPYRVVCLNHQHHSKQNFQMLHLPMKNTLNIAPMSFNGYSWLWHAT